MDQWTRRLRDHEVWQAMDELGQAIDAAVRREGVDHTALESLERLRNVLTFAGKRLSAAEPQLILVAQVDAIRNQFREVVSLVKAFAQGADQASLDTANTYVDPVLIALAGLVTPLGPDDLQGLRQTATQFRDTMGKGAEAAFQAAHALAPAVDALKEQVSALQSQVAAERQTLVNVASEFQGQFSTAQAERQKTFEAARSEIREDLEEEIQGFREARERHTVLQDQNIAGIRTEFVGKSEGLLKQIEADSEESKKLLEAIGQRGIATDFLGAAAEAKRSTQLWQLLTVVAFGIVLLVGWAVFLSETKPDEITWPGLAGRAFLMGAAGLLASFCSSQAGRYQRAERTYRQQGMDMAALGPFLAKLSPAEQEKLRIKVGETTFVHSAQDQGSDEASGTVIGLMLSNRELNRTVRELGKVVPEAVKALKGPA